jgi:hypothetical protein
MKSFSSHIDLKNSTKEEAGKKELHINIVKKTYGWLNLQQ